jgi:DNA repair protein RadA/Sms
VPPGATPGPAGLQVLTADNITGALQVLRRIADNGGQSEETRWS